MRNFNWCLHVVSVAVSVPVQRIDSCYPSHNSILNCYQLMLVLDQSIGSFLGSGRVGGVGGGKNQVIVSRP